ncbi:N-formylglutamate deformylase [Enterobacteriaceae bacterium BIT-l23]|uniref:N-formylglutamate deformylase n=1 Tax=Jejubacter sp. L23 TaxID=3092086 RepID=UPI001585A6C2|nr:N-formylglutamate deformylase [Enterobacteriaceae bacterium BIT-l23]
MMAYDFHQGSAPLLVSIPHAGTRLTPEAEQGLSPEALPLPDTDWHIPELYDFATGLGASIIRGHYSRFVVDLNRAPDDTPLYASATTGLFPQTLFDGTPAWKAGKEPDDACRQRWLAEIWQPYHQKLQAELARIRQQHGYVVLYDAHSIASVIPRLFDGALPDINLGTNDGRSCPPAMAQAMVELCESYPQYRYVLNGRFKGGYITRQYGSPARRQYAVQVELAQCNYMRESHPFNLVDDKAKALKPLLRAFLERLANGGDFGA